jgi:hypothetical protein
MGRSNGHHYRNELPAGRHPSPAHLCSPLLDIRVPAAAVVLLVILFPWVFTLFMSMHDWKVSGATSFVGLANYAKMLEDERFQWAIVRTLWLTAASVIAPLLLGVWAAVCFASQIKLRGLARTPFRDADDGDTGRHRAGVDHDVPSAAWRTQLPADLGGVAAIELGV